MSLSDPIGDMLARIKNAQVRNHSKVSLPSSKFKSKIADVLKAEGYIIDYKINDSSVESVKDKEAKLLKLNCDKALRDLKWEPALDFKNTVKFTTDWYKLYLENGNQDDCLYNLTVQQIKMINEKYGFS